jgi:hypothetical protein
VTAKRDGFTAGEVGLFALGSLAGAVVGLAAVGQLAHAMSAGAPGFWFVSRAAGIVSYLMLWGSTVWGVLLTSKGMGGFRSGPLAFALHNVLSWLALGFSTVHALSLLGDSVVPFTAGAVLIPFAANYQTFLTGLGTLSLYIGVLVSVTFYWKKRIGYRAWRVIHMLSYLMFAMVTVHGATIGTDSGTRVMQMVYLLAGGSVLFVTLYRILTSGGESKPAGTALEPAAVPVRTREG